MDSSQQGDRVGVLKRSVTPHQLKYPHLKWIPIGCFSLASGTLGVASIGVQIAALIINATQLHNYIYSGLGPVATFDYAATGIWAGFFFVVAGNLGMRCTAPIKRSKSLLLWTMLFSALSIAASIVEATLSGLAASGFCYYPSNGDLCYKWFSLELSLMSFGISEFIVALSLFVLILLEWHHGPSWAPSHLHPPMPPVSFQENPVMIIGQQQQPLAYQQVYFQPQPAPQQLVYIQAGAPAILPVQVPVAYQ